MGFESKVVVSSSFSRSLPSFFSLFRLVGGKEGGGGGRGRGRRGEGEGEGGGRGRGRGRGGGGGGEGGGGASYLPLSI